MAEITNIIRTKEDLRIDFISYDDNEKHCIYEQVITEPEEIEKYYTIVDKEKYLEEVFNPEQLIVKLWDPGFDPEAVEYEEVRFIIDGDEDTRLTHIYD